MNTSPWMKRFRFSPVWCLALLLLAQPVATVRPVLAQQAIPINVILPMTGPEAYLGKQGKTALEIAEKIVNARPGAPVQLIVHDDQSNNEVALQLLAQMTAAHVNVILGPMGGGTCRALGPMVVNGPVDYCFSPTMHATAGTFVFMTGVDTYDLDRSLIRYVRLRGWKRIGLITSTDATGNDAAYAFETALKDPTNAGISIVAKTNFDASDISVSGQLARIKAADPDVLFAWTTGLGMGTIFRAIQQVDLKVPVFSGWGNMTYTEMKSWSSILPKNLNFVATPWFDEDSKAIDPQVATSLRAMNRAFSVSGEKMDAGADIVWDPFMITVQVLRKLGPAATAEQIRDAIDGIKGYVGINGVYDFTRYPQRGVGEANAVIARWSPQAGSWKLVSNPYGIPLQTAGK